MVAEHILALVDPRWRDEFEKFLETGTAADAFLEYFDQSPAAQRAADLAFDTEEGFTLEKFAEFHARHSAQPADAERTSRLLQMAAARRGAPTQGVDHELPRPFSALEDLLLESLAASAGSGGPCPPRIPNTERLVRAFAGDLSSYAASHCRSWMNPSVLVRGVLVRFAVEANAGALQCLGSRRIESIAAEELCSRLEQPSREHCQRLLTELIAAQLRRGDAPAAAAVEAAGDVEPPDRRSAAEEVEATLAEIRQRLAAPRRQGS